MMDFRRTDMALLVALDALLAERSVTAAARRLGISQPAMSAQLGKLRGRLGDPVLVGDAHGMLPTARMEALQAPLRAHLASLQELVFTAQTFDPATAARTFRIAATDYALALVMPRLLKALGDTAPGVRLAALPFSAPEAEAQLENGAVDLVMTSERLIPKTVPALKLVEDDFSLAARAGHPLRDRFGELDVFCALDHVAVLPTRIARAERAGLCVVPPPVDVPRFATYAAWHARLSRDPGHRWLRELIGATMA